MKVYKSFIDHEEYKIKIKLSSSTYMILLQDMDRFGFIKSNEEFNINSFINYILPIIYEYRNIKDNKLVELLSKSILLKELDVLVDKINYLFNEDDISYHNEIINLRISKKNMELFDSIFNDKHKKKSTYIRSLLNQYSSLKLDMREFVCFNKEYHFIESAIKNSLILEIFAINKKMQIMPILIETCQINSEIFIFGLTNIDNKIYIKSIKLCDLRNLHIIGKSNYVELDSNMNEKIEKYILEFEYLNNESKKIGEI